VNFIFFPGNRVGGADWNAGQTAGAAVDDVISYQSLANPGRTLFIPNVGDIFILEIS
jgi:hypothetical protein